MAASKKLRGKVVEVPGRMRPPGAMAGREPSHATPPCVSQVGRTSLLHSSRQTTGWRVRADDPIALVAALIAEWLLMVIEDVAALTSEDYRPRMIAA